MSTAIIDYGSGNLHSARKAFERAAKESGAAGDIVVTSDPAAVRAAERIVLPGVGAFADCMAGLAAVPGLIEAMTEAVQREGKPFLGICVGMQLLASLGREHVVTRGLGWIDGEVRPVVPADPALKIPHMGWNTLHLKAGHPLFEDIATGEDGLHAYFVHSYQLYAETPGDVLATTDYAGPISAVVARNNVAGTQFHPEKSQRLGLSLIGNFLRWRP